MIQTKAFQLVELGGQLSQATPAISWQNGASSQRFGLYNLSSLFGAQPNVTQLKFTPTSTAALFEELLQVRESKSEIYCETPFYASFCIDASALKSAMASAEESFLPDKFTSASVSTSTCLQFCQGVDANVSLMLYVSGLMTLAAVQLVFAFSTISKSWVAFC